MTFEKILAELRKNANSKNIEQMRKFGISPEKTFGVKVPILRNLAKKIGKNHELAQKLWAEKFRETQILAALVDEPGKVPAAQIENWISDFNYWEICDATVANLFEKIPENWARCEKFAADDREFFRRTGFVLMARFAVSDKTAADEKFLPFLKLIKKFATDERNLVKKAVNWALRQIGKRNLFLREKALKTAREILKIKNSAAKWIARDAIRELENEKVVARIRN